MDQLSGFDSFVLSEEREHNYSHVGTLALYDQSTAPHGKVRFKEILTAITERMAISKVFRRRLARVPFGLDRPYWDEEDEVDLEFHVRHIALPQPGDWRQLMIQVARLHSRPLDRSRPLWEMYVIEGIDNVPGLPHGAFAIYTKIHHAVVDGATAIELVRRLHDGEAADLTPVAPTAALDDTAMVKNVLGRTAARAGRGARFSLNSAQKLAGIALDRVAQKLNRATTIEDESKPGMPNLSFAPSTRFSRPVSANRAIEGVGLPFDEMRRIRALVPGSTINDVFLAVSGGAMRRYLLSKDELPERSLTALMPISLRESAPDLNQPSNDVGGVPVSLHTDIADPVEQLRAVQKSAREAKQQADLLGRDLVISLVDVLPHFVSGALIRNLMIRQLSTTVSNVRGPDRPVAFVGARLLRFYPISMVTDGAGINHTSISYDGTLWIGVVACRNLLPDPDFYAQCLRDSFNALLSRADAVGERAPRSVARTAKVRTIGKSAKPRGRSPAPRTRRNRLAA